MRRKTSGNGIRRLKSYQMRQKSILKKIMSRRNRNSRKWSINWYFVSLHINNLSSAPVLPFPSSLGLRLSLGFKMEMECEGTVRGSPWQAEITWVKDKWWDDNILGTLLLAWRLSPKSRKERGMLDLPWLAVELREWFASTRLTFLCTQRLYVNLRSSSLHSEYVFVPFRLHCKIY